MNLLPLLFLLVNAAALLSVPRRWAPLPFIMTACYLSLDQSFDAGPLTFTALRVLIAVGTVRALVRGERLVGGIARLDWWLLAWALWAVASAFFHTNPQDALINRLGLVYNTLGIYILLRIFCSSIGDVIGLSRATAILLMPVAIEMIYEMTGHPSLFYTFAGNELPLYIREGRVRALGPFVHPILAGTVGGVCLPLMVALWDHRRKAAIAGIAACLAMIVSSASSGPLMSLISSAAALLMWPYRYRMRSVRWMTAGVFIALMLAMNAPIYYLIARVNVVGGSTGYHRALLIESSIKYFDQWWLTGTEVTRHWAPSPGHTPEHTDITNHYLRMGVIGGVPLLFLFAGGLTHAFSLLGRRLRASESPRDQFVLWALGASLFSHAVTFLSVSYFDQAFVFVYVTLAAIGSARCRDVEQAARAEMATPRPLVASWTPRPGRAVDRPMTGVGAGQPRRALAGITRRPPQS